MVSLPLKSKASTPQSVEEAAVLRPLVSELLRIVVHKSLCLDEHQAILKELQPDDTEHGKLIDRVLATSRKAVPTEALVRFLRVTLTAAAGSALDGGITDIERRVRAILEEEGIDYGPFVVDTDAWLHSPAIRSLSYAGRGIWVELLLLMHERQVADLCGPPTTIAAMVNCSVQELDQCSREFVSAGLAQVVRNPTQIAIRQLAKW